MFKFKMYALVLGFAFAILVPFTLADITPTLEQKSEKDTPAKANWRSLGYELQELSRQNGSDINKTCLIRGDYLQNELTVAQLDYQNLVTQVHSKPYITSFTHLYEDLELEEWGGPTVNQERCLHQLKQLNERADRIHKERSESKDANFIQLLDTYEWYTSGSSSGGNEWPGEYNECLRLKINSTEGLVPTRYCSGAFKRNKWPKEGRLNQLLAHRVGVCLPKSCDSSRYKNKFELIEKLVNFNARKVDEGDINLNYLYCLPDQQSRLRLWYYSPKTVSFVVCITFWVVLITTATFKYKSHEDSFHEGNNYSFVNLYKSLSLMENAKSLFTITSAKKGATKNEERDINLDAVRGIKMIVMCYVITGHALLGFILIKGNGQAINSQNMVLHIMTSALAVNVLYSITGLQTACLLFKGTKFITQPALWIVLVATHYIKVMPLYVLVVMYQKYLAKHTGSGPFWDYGTSSLSLRRVCEEEPWFWTLSFAANFKGPLQHCIPSAWYLANDFQFLLVTPILFALLHKFPRLGTFTAISATLMGYLLPLVGLVTVGYDLNPMIQSHEFSTRVFLLTSTYNHPQYRIPAYLYGLLIGHAIYRHKQQKMLKVSNCGKPTKMVDWPEWMKRHGVKLCFLTFISFFGLPILRELLQGNKSHSGILDGRLLPAYNLLFAIAIGSYILSTVTGNSNESIKNFLASPRWKPFLRLNLCAMLIHNEVINYFAQTSTHLLYFDFKIIAGLYLFSIVMTYLFAAVICVLFESPLHNLINNYLLASLTKVNKQHED